MAQGMFLGAGTILDDHIEQSGATERFASHQPAFRWEEHTMNFSWPHGPVQHRWILLWDHDKLVGFMRVDEMIWDFTTFEPGKGLSEVIQVPRYHNATLVHTRIRCNDHARVKKGDRREVTTSTDGARAKLEWKQHSSAKGSEHHFNIVVDVDPVVGYRAVVDFVDRRREPSGKPVLEFVNLMTRGLADPWPGQASYDRTAISQGGSIVNWHNNLGATELSDNNTSKAIDENGFVAWFGGSDPWGAALQRLGRGHSFSSCNVWSDHHNHFKMVQRPNAEGWYETSPVYILQGIPPETTARLEEVPPLNWNDNKTFFIRIGEVEDFDGIPRGMTSNSRGLWSPYFGSRYQLVPAMGKDGSTALKVEGMATQGASSKKMGTLGFIQAPQVPLHPASTYCLSAWVKRGEGLDIIRLEARTYEWSPHSNVWFGEAKTSSPQKVETWEKVELIFETPSHWDPQVDLRIVAIGDGVGWVDDFYFEKVKGPPFP